MGSVFILLHNKFAVKVYDAFSLQSVRFYWLLWSVSNWQPDVLHQIFVKHYTFCCYFMNICSFLF